MIKFKGFFFSPNSIVVIDLFLPLFPNFLWNWTAFKVFIKGNIRVTKIILTKARIVKNSWLFIFLNSLLTIMYRTLKP